MATDSVERTGSIATDSAERTESIATDESFSGEGAGEATSSRSTGAVSGTTQSYTNEKGTRIIITDKSWSEDGHRTKSSTDSVEPDYLTTAPTSQISNGTSGTPATQYVVYTDTTGYVDHTHTKDATKDAKTTENVTGEIKTTLGNATVETSTEEPPRTQPERVTTERKTEKSSTPRTQPERSTLGNATYTEETPKSQPERVTTERTTAKPQNATSSQNSTSSQPVSDPERHTNNTVMPTDQGNEATIEKHYDEGTSR
eukprot:sb/3468528/